MSPPKPRLSTLLGSVSAVNYTLRSRSGVQLSPAAERILLVDDDEIIRDAARRMLEHLGYRVVTARSGPIALELYRELRSDISLVILDLFMPEMTGEETFQRLREQDSTARVLLSSGSPEDGTIERLLNRGAIGFLPKPYTLDQLTRQLHQVLAA